MHAAVHRGAEAPARNRNGRGPLAALVRDHDRQIAIGETLEHLAHNPRHGATAAEIRAMLAYLARDFELHIEDEEEDVLPLLGQRCADRERVAEVTTTMAAQHVADEQLAMALLVELERLLAGRPLRAPERFFADARALADNLRRHVEWEEHVIAPLARKWLGRHDRARLRRHIAARHDTRKT